MEKEIRGKKYVLKTGGCGKCAFGDRINTGCLDAGLECLDGVLDNEAVKHWEPKDED